MHAADPAAACRGTRSRGYRPIADYAAIGDCHGGALVARDGSIDWACLRRFDADPVFWRLLDASRGGHCSVRPSGRWESERSYLDGTNILQTAYRRDGALVRVTDFMPVGRDPGAGANDYVKLVAPGCIVRRVEAVGGDIELEVECAPAPAWRDCTPTPVAGGWSLGEGLALRGDIDLRASRCALHARERLRAGERRYLVIGALDNPVTGSTVDNWLAVTQAYWREWSAYCRYDGRYRDAVVRSALALKLMTYAPTGACVAAFTTSLPEAIGGARNWDYRYCWIRDASLMLHALASLGYSGESHAFFEFLCERLANGPERLQVLYGIEGEARLDERVLEGVDGYEASRPVRVGNAAFAQRQTDVYGYIMEGALVYRALGGRLARGDREVLRDVARFVERCWREPDAGIWESRGPMRHYVYSKAACWVALDRAIRLFGARGSWDTSARRILESIRSEGIRDGHLVNAFDDPEPQVDASLLQLPSLGVPLAADVLARTLEAAQRSLVEGDLVHRRPRGEGRVHEGTFAVCSFWLVDALLAQGRLDEARGIFERLLARANDVGLYSEEIDARSGGFLGNFPQAFTHLGLINSAVSIALCEKGGAHAVRGGYAARARRAVGYSVGWRGALWAWLHRGHVRWRGSSASVLHR